MPPKRFRGVSRKVTVTTLEPHPTMPGVKISRTVVMGPLQQEKARKEAIERNKQLNIEQQLTAGITVQERLIYSELRGNTPDEFIADGVTFASMFAPGLQKYPKSTKELIRDMNARVSAGDPTLKRKRANSLSASNRDSVRQRREEHGDDLASKPLPELLDFTNIIEDDGFSVRFAQIASALLRDYRLVLSYGNEEFEFEMIEIEFYLYKSGSHEDPFTHASEEQRQSGQWYFHRAPTNTKASSSPSTVAGGYRGGTRKGLDLTLGGSLLGATSPYFSQPAEDAATTSTMTAPAGPQEARILRGGVLLRTIRRVSDGKVISGPSLVVDEILRLSAASSVADLVHAKWADDISAFAPARPASLQLRQLPTAGTRTETVYVSPRIGLELSHRSVTGTTASTSPRTAYIAKPYRFFTRPHLLTASGRAHTFLGVYRSCLGAGPWRPRDFYREEALIAKAAELTGLTEGVARRYLGEFKSGTSDDSLLPFVGPEGKGVASSPSAFLRLMGCLRRLMQEELETIDED